MTPDELSDRLDSLAHFEPDPRRARRVAEECRQRIVRRHTPPTPARGRLSLEDVLLGGFCVIYLLAVIRVSLGLG